MGSGFKLQGSRNCGCLGSGTWIKDLHASEYLGRLVHIGKASEYSRILLAMTSAH